VIFILIFSNFVAEILQLSQACHRIKIPDHSDPKTYKEDSCPDIKEIMMGDILSIQFPE
jgi:hypothetical protein